MFRNAKLFLHTYLKRAREGESEREHPFGGGQDVYTFRENLHMAHKIAWSLSQANQLFNYFRQTIIILGVVKKLYDRVMWELKLMCSKRKK